MITVKKYWHWILAVSVLLGETAIFMLCRKNIYVGICDNLDLFIVQLKMLHDNNAFFAQNQNMLMLGGIDRNYFPTEFSLYNLLYLILPDIYAYITGYILKLLISFASCMLLARLLLQESCKRYEKPVVLVSAAFALLPLYPMYALCFASIPLILYLLIRIYRQPKWYLYIAVFFYPFVSYFTFFGAFILGYLLIAIVILWIRDKKPSVSLMLALLVLAAGFVCFDYRLFDIMLMSDDETIRSTMVIASYGAADLWKCFVDVFLRGFSHARSAHTYIVLPVCALYFIWNNMRYITKRKQGKFYTDLFNLTVLFILFNCAVHALYYWEPLRNLVEILVPPLKGFQYGRTIFFNTFAWYFAFFIVIREIFDKKQMLSYAVALLAVLSVIGTQCEYSDFYNTCYCNLYRVMKHKEPNQLSYNEFYGGSLIKTIKNDIDYTPDKGACTYGFHPAMLSYNGISTIDGYCGYYSQSYKERFRTAIAPTLSENENWRKYYDEWGCRAYLFSDDGTNTYDFGANANDAPQNIIIAESELKELGCDYIFSRMEIANAEEMDLSLVKRYSDDEMPYSVWLYELE